MTGWARPSSPRDFRLRIGSISRRAARGFLLDDGRLNYRREQILELYYRAQLTKSIATGANNGTTQSGFSIHPQPGFQCGSRSGTLLGSPLARGVLRSHAARPRLRFPLLFGTPELSYTACRLCFEGDRGMSATGVLSAPGFPGPRAHHCGPWLQPLADSTLGTGHPPLHRHGLRLLRILAAAVEGGRHHQSDQVSGGHGPVRSRGRAAPATGGFRSCSGPSSCSSSFSGSAAFLCGGWLERAGPA